MSVGGCLHEAVEGRLCKGLWKTVQLAVQRLPEWCEHRKKEERERDREEEGKAETGRPSAALASINFRLGYCLRVLMVHVISEGPRTVSTQLSQLS